MDRAIRVISCGWLIVAASYISWTYCAIGQGTARTALSNVNIFAWSFATPLATIVAAPIAAVLVWRSRSTLGPVLLLLVAGNWLVVSALIARHHLLTPTRLTAILILSLLTIPVAGLDYRQRARLGASTRANVS